MQSAANIESSTMLSHSRGGPTRNWMLSNTMPAVKPVASVPRQPRSGTQRSASSTAKVRTHRRGAMAWARKYALLGKTERVGDLDDAQLFSVQTYQAHLGDADFTVDAIGFFSGDVESSYKC